MILAEKQFFVGYAEASCRGYAEHFIKTKVTATAKAICNSCPAKDACYDYALENELYNVWAGTSASERQQIRDVMGIPTPHMLGPSIMDVSAPKNKEMVRENARIRNIHYRARKAANV